MSKNLKDVMYNRESTSLQYSHHKEKEDKRKKITSKLPAFKESKQSKHNCSIPYNSNYNLDEELSFNLTSYEIEMINKIAENWNMSVQGTFETVIHDALSLYKEVMKLSIPYINIKQEK